MAHNKNQHFVPQFYFRLFSIDKKRIEIFNKTKGIHKTGSIKGQCSSNYFYGKNLEIEKINASLEGLGCFIIKKIISSRNLRCLTDGDLFNLMTFMMFQYTRTKNIKQVTENLKDFFFDNYVKPLLKSDLLEKNPNIDSSFLDKTKLNVKGLHSNSILLGLTSPITIADLEIALLINETKKDFIFSDSPVVLHNTIFNNLKNAGTRGFASKGLQIFYPLNNELMLMFYDSNAYDVSSQNMYNIKIKSEKEINKINLLQFIYCDQNLYFSRSNQSNYVTKLFSGIRGKIKKNKIGINIYRNAKNPLRELHQVIEEKIEFNLSLSFLQLNDDLKYDNGIRETSLHELNNSFVDEIFERNSPMNSNVTYLDKDNMTYYKEKDNDLFT